jgi:putative sulfotransferase
MSDVPVCLVVSTGRCGSTVLSDMMAEHPGIVSVSELFSSVPETDLVERELDGAAFWDLLSRRRRVDLMMLRCGIGVDELRYPVDAPRPGASRFARATGLPPPPVAQVTLPHLTDRPDDLYDAIERDVVRLPVRPLSRQFRWLFDALSAGRRPRLVVERSGGSLAYAASLLAMFPHARVVHLYRDGRECAVSMSGHPRYKLAMLRSRLAARLGYDPYADGAPVSTVDGLDPALHALLPQHITGPAYHGYDIPLPRYGMAWSKMIMEGLAMLSDHPNVLSLDYRDLVTSPVQSIDRLLGFLGLDRDGEVPQRMAAKVGRPRDTRATVGEQRWHELTRACRSGMNRLYGRGGWN